MDFVILKVNGQDLRNATHEKAVDAFRRAKEPILVEVARRESIGEAKSLEVQKLENFHSIGCQTDHDTDENWHSLTASAGSCSKSLERIYSSVPSRLLNIIGSDSEEFPSDPAVLLGDLIELDDTNPRLSTIDDPKFIESRLSHFTGGGSCPCHDPANREYDKSYKDNLDVFSRNGTFSSMLDRLVFKEVQLSRSMQTGKFGLTLCYQNKECNVSDECDVYVGEVDGNDGASEIVEDIQVGDRIVKIDGNLINSKHEAIRLFRDGENTVQLLIARQASHQPIISQVIREDLLGTNFSVQEGGELFKAYTRTDQDSGLGRVTDDSGRTEESSEPDCEYENKSPLRGSDLMPSSPIPNENLVLNSPILNSRSDEIDLELSNLGQLMQSLALHCRQLLQAKAQNRRVGSNPADSSTLDEVYVDPNPRSNIEVHLIQNDIPSVAPMKPRMGIRSTGGRVDVNLEDENASKQMTDSVMLRNNHMLPNHQTHPEQKNVTEGAVENTDDYNIPQMIAYPGVQQMNSTLTSAYCTGESMKSQVKPEYGIGVRLWKCTTSEPNHTANMISTDPSISDFGGSLLSLTAYHHPHNSIAETNVPMNHPFVKSLSPLSSWSIDEHSRYALVNSCITPLSIDDSNERLTSGACTSESDGLHRSRPLGISNISSADSLHVEQLLNTTSSTLPPIDPIHQNLLGTEEQFRKSFETANSDSQATQSHTNKPSNHLKSPRKNERTHFISRQVKKQRAGLHTHRCGQMVADPNAICCTTAENTSSPVHRKAPQAVITPIQRCVNDCYNKTGGMGFIQNPHNIHPPSTSSSAPNSEISQPARVASDSSIHPYEFYDRFCSRKWIEKIYQQIPLPRIPQPEEAESDRLRERNDGENLVINPVEPDIYEVPYASVTIEDDTYFHAHHVRSKSSDQPRIVPDIQKQNRIAYPLPREPQSYRPQLFARRYAPTTHTHRSPYYSQPTVSPKLSYSNLIPTSSDQPNHTDLCAVADSNSMMEWVVKKRPDGTRYITRRPIRARWLKERAKRTNDETLGISTVDNAPDSMMSYRHLPPNDRRKLSADRRRRRPNSGLGIENGGSKTNGDQQASVRYKRSVKQLVGKTAV